MASTSTPKNDIDNTPLDTEDGPAISVPDTSDAGEGGKLKMIIQLVKKCLGVKDIASMRLSLPASLLEPIPNLEYWHYLDRPDLFAAINDSDDDLERMLAVLRFTFTKDLKFIHGRVVKPYNSVLGETFRSHWDVVPVLHPSSADTPIPMIYTSEPAPPSLPPSAISSGTAVNTAGLGPSDASSIKSGKSGKSSKSALSASDLRSPSTAATSLVESNVDAQISNLSLADDADDETDANLPRLRVVYLTEQVSHHPPISAYYAACRNKHIEMSGIDQISAKVSGMTVRVAPGSFNKGIYIKLTGGPGEGENYKITHPIASVNGILKGSFYITVGDTSIITCSGGKPGEKLRAIIEYKEESWIGRALFRLEGCIHKYTEGEADVENWTKIKHVPPSRIVATFDGSWRHLIRWRRAGAPVEESETLLDLSMLRIIPKIVRPLDRQQPHESRKLWDSVTSRLQKKEYNEATKHKLAIEQRQRDEAAERKRKNIEFVPKFFDRDIDSGIPTLTPAGLAAFEEEFKEGSAYPLL